MRKTAICERIVKGPWQGSDSYARIRPASKFESTTHRASHLLFSSGANDSTRPLVPTASRLILHKWTVPGRERSRVVCSVPWKEAR